MQTEHRLYSPAAAVSGHLLWMQLRHTTEKYWCRRDQRSKCGERCLTSAMKGLPSAINNALDPTSAETSLNLAELLSSLD